MAQPPLPPQLLQKYLENQCTDPEKELVENWYASLDGQRNYLDKLAEQERSNLQSETFAQIKNRIHENQESGIPKQFPWRWISGIAACLIMAFGLYIQLQKPASISTSKLMESEMDITHKMLLFTNEEPRIVMHKLPDGSTVWMHAEASIRYPEKFDAHRRLVSFSGEGFFDIEKDKSRPFSIQSGEMVIKVLGTSFNVNATAAKKIFQISVVTGSVEVTAPDRERKDQLVILKPQQQVLFETQSKRLIVSTIPISGKKEIYQPITVTFKDTPLNQVVEQLQKKFNVEILLANPEIATCQVNADFEQQSLPVIMEMLCTTLDAHYTMSERTIHITGVPCD